MMWSLHTGGKLDDITVIVAHVVKEKHPSFSDKAIIDPAAPNLQDIGVGISPFSDSPPKDGVEEPFLEKFSQG